MKIKYCRLIRKQIDPVHCAYEVRIGRKCTNPNADSAGCYIAEKGPRHSLDFMRELDHDQPATLQERRKMQGASSLVQKEP